jgi:hypothetical protein
MSKIQYQWSIVSIGNYIKITNDTDNSIYVPQNTITLSKIDNNTIELNLLAENTILKINYIDVINPISISADDLLINLSSLIYKSAAISTGGVLSIASTLTGYVSGSGVISSNDSILSAIQKLNGNIYNKQDIITLTTTGNSGSSTLISSTLNIPTYTLSGLGGISLTSLSVISPLLYNNLTGVFSIQVSNSIQNGYLSSTDWNTFNNKQTALNGTGFVKITGTTISYDNSSYYLASNPNNYITLTALSSTITGLTYTNTTGIFSLTTGYVIPTTTDQTNWNIAYSNRITSLTVTGNSGSSTLISNVLNIPTYTLSGLDGQSLSTNLTSLSALTFVSTSFVKMSATGTFVLDTNTYLTSNQTITLSGDVTGTGTTSITTSITDSIINSKLLTGYVSGAGTITATDSILQAIQKLNGNISWILITVDFGTVSLNEKTFNIIDVNCLTTSIIDIYIHIIKVYWKLILEYL